MIKELKQVALEKALHYCNKNGISANRITTTETSDTIEVAVQLTHFLFIKKINIRLLGDYDISDNYLGLYNAKDVLSVAERLIDIRVDFEFDAQYLSITTKDFKILDFDGGFYLVREYEE